jgi:hypothetical protein
MKKLPDSTLSLAEVGAAFASVIDDELAAKRDSLAKRMREARERAQHGRFWRDIATRAAADAAVTRAGGRA